MKYVIAECEKCEYLKSCYVKDSDGDFYPEMLFSGCTEKLVGLNFALLLD